jgi:hypothetical protein
VKAKVANHEIKSGGFGERGFDLLTDSGDSSDGQEL